MMQGHWRLAAAASSSRPRQGLRGRFTVGGDPSPERMQPSPSSWPGTKKGNLDAFGSEGPSPQAADGRSSWPAPRHRGLPGAGRTGRHSGSSRTARVNQARDVVPAAAPGHRRAGPGTRRVRRWPAQARACRHTWRGSAPEGPLSQRLWPATFTADGAGQLHSRRLPSSRRPSGPGTGEEKSHPLTRLPHSPIRPRETERLPHHRQVNAAAGRFRPRQFILARRRLPLDAALLPDDLATSPPRRRRRDAAVQPRPLVPAGQSGRSTR